MEIINVYDGPDCWVCHTELAPDLMYPGMIYTVCPMHLTYTNWIKLADLPDFGGCWRE